MKREEEQIHKHDNLYNLLRAFAMFGFRNFYRRIQVKGRENIPYGSHFIITPNHQNALMDAMAVLFAVNDIPIVFLARADIFKNKRQKKMLTTFKMLPVYRIRDGVQELTKNEEIFERSVNIVTDRVPVCLMPEGNHGGKRRLRKFVKGAFRVALKAQEMSGKENNVLILPIGIDFQNYSKIHQDLLIIIGKPINVQDYISEYSDNQAKGLNSLRDRVAEEMKKIMIHIKNEELYEMYQNLRQIWNKRMRQLAGIQGKSLFDKFNADKIMISILDYAYETETDTLRDLSEKTDSYLRKLNALKIRNWVISRKGFPVTKIILVLIALLITMPVALYGFLNNALPYHLPVRFTRKVKDLQFLSSFKFVLALLLFPGFYIIQTIIIAIFINSIWVAFAYLISLPFTGYLALYWSLWFKKWKSALKYKYLHIRNNEGLKETESLYEQIFRTMETLSEKYLQSIKPKAYRLKHD